MLILLRDLPALEPDAQQLHQPQLFVPRPRRRFAILGPCPLVVRANRQQQRIGAIALEHTGSGPDAWGGFRAGFETTFTFKRSDFGMDEALRAVSDEVRLTISIETVRQ